VGNGSFPDTYQARLDRDLRRPKVEPDNHMIMPDPTAPNLLGRIISFRTGVGDGLNDEELTRLLLQEALPSEEGFTFVSLCEACATFNVPPQDPAKWYPEKGWIAPEKEAIARAIAKKCGLSLCEPPDERFTFRSLESEAHHHLEMGYQSEAIVIAHPLYLKIRLFGFANKRPLPLPRNLLEQLAALYLEHLAALYRT